MMYTLSVCKPHGIHSSIRGAPRALAIALLITTASVHAPSGHAAEHALPRFLTTAGAPLPIDCGATPFGSRVVMSREAEFVDLITTSGGSRELHFSQFDADNDTSVAWIDAQIPGTGTFEPLDVVGADLNGDGREEAIVASSRAAGGVRLDVYAHDGQNGVTHVDVWQWATTGVPDVQLIVGDFDGSMDGRQELGVLVRFDASVGLFILEGSDSGGIAQAAGEAAGNWTAPADASNLSIATGDLLLDGRDQIVIGYVTFPGGTELHYHLLEFATEIPELLPVAPGNENIGAIEFIDDISDGFPYDQGGVVTLDINNFDRMDLAAGNVVDTAAAELVTFFGYEDSSESYHISMRLQHFNTTRDAQNHITSIALAIRPDGEPFDSAVHVGEWSNSAASFDGLVANVESSNDPNLGLAEIVLANAPNDYGTIDLYAYKVHVNLDTGFLWESDGMAANFTNTSVGAVTNYSWEFGDGTGPVTGVENPSHTYAANGTYDALLTIAGPDGVWIDDYETQVQIDGTPHNGGRTPPYVYVIDQPPAYAGSHQTTANSPDHLNVAVGDLDADAKDEIVTIATIKGEVLRSVWKASPPSLGQFVATHRSEPIDSGAGTVQLDTLDFDGDTVQATIAENCLEVDEPQVRQLVWLPPYFERLQVNAEKLATFGKSITGGTETEDLAGSFTSHSISGYIGGGTAAAGAGGSIEAILSLTAGYNYQASRGEIHGSGHERTVHEGFSQDHGEALLVLEENRFKCYTYDVSTQADGELDYSDLRMCAKIEDSEHMTGTDAVAWDTTIPADSAYPPAQWMPLHRDWSSMALFQPVSSNTQFVAGQGPEKATDGLFSTEARSSATSDAPYLEIDLGSVREISNIRVFPSDEHAGDLAGARILASATPLGAPPWGPDVHVYQPATEDDTVYNRWDAWTRDSAQPDQMLKARYVQIRLPGDAALHVAEIQVFGPVHVDPPHYPDAVCDANLDDGFFLARIWDPAIKDFRTVEVHGDLLWDGTWDDGASPWGSCTNDTSLPNASIWSNVTVGGSASVDWSLGQASSGWVGETTSFESAIRVGATFDFQAGLGAAIAFGGAYEFAAGLSGETQTSSYWTEGLETGGAIAGFAPEFSGLISECAYNPRPYAYHLTEYSVVGYRHDIYVVDYIVHQSAATWQRNDISILCTRADAIFANGFD